MGKVRYPERQCPRYRIHWFAYYGWVGSSAPICRRCGVDNPNYDPDRDPFAGESSC